MVALHSKQICPMAWEETGGYQFEAMVERMVKLGAIFPSGTCQNAQLVILFAH
jgi:hypothetical protein